MHIWVPLPLTQRTSKVKSGGHLELSKAQGPTEFVTDYGTQGARYIRPRCIGTVRARTQMLINQSINCTVPAFSPPQLLISHCQKS